MSRRCEGQFGDDHVAQRFAGHIHSGPETVGAEEHRVDILAELPEQPGSGQILPLHQQSDAVFGEISAQRVGAVAQRLVVGEEHERLAVGELDEAGNLAGERGVEMFRARIRHVAGDVDLRLVRTERGV